MPTPSSAEMHILQALTAVRLGDLDRAADHLVAALASVRDRGARVDEPAEPGSA